MSDYKTYSDKVFSEALFAAYFRLNDEVAKLHKECAALQAENERLRNDANELADNLEKAAGNTASHYNCLIKWRAAKEVQP